MKQETFLREIGLTQNEAKIYLALIELDNPSASQISKKANVFKKNTYDALEELSKKGLATHNIKKGTKHWQSTDPERIKDIIEEKLDKATKIVPELKKKQKEKNNEKRVEVYEGKEGIKSLHNLILKEKKTVYNIGATNKFFEYLQYYAPQFIRKGKKQGIKAKFIFNADAKITKEQKNSPEFEHKILPKNFKTATQIILFGNYSTILIWSTEPVAILIESKEITKGFTQYFKFLWKIAK